MRARTRFWLDIALAITLVAAWRPSWTGIDFHQWLSIALISPLLLHTIVNWDWTLRILRSFAERLLHTSRLNLVVDLALFVSTVTVMVSGFMVSPGLLGAVGIRVTTSLAWHYLHLWSANATIALLAIHFGLHWRWLVATAKRLAEKPADALARTRSRIRTAASARTQTRLSARAASATSGLIEIGSLAETPATSHRSRVGSRAAEAAKERASALRVASVLGVTSALVFAVFVAEGVASPLLPGGKTIASAGSQICPVTGCKASTCHGTSHADPYTFYGIKKPAKKTKRSTRHRTAAPTVIAKAQTTTSKSPSSKAAVASASKKTAAKMVATKTVKRAVTKAKPTATTVAKKKTTKLMTCPSTGCTASSCHGAHHQSASSYYK